ncbi:large ribosomal subunit protein uL23m isoform X1 [Sminthopsis crassicaudata]|uniref:large ribosomal subunit protein uL23m isoform X1 n=1 Tax=Sminthopsis crassicaudata TaxID=9301 RepID=UPI003D69E850
MARNVLYPLYQAGNPQLRIFRTNFFIQLVRPGRVQPEDTVQFRIPMEMTRVDLKNYLQSIYNVPVAAVRTRIQHALPLVTRWWRFRIRRAMVRGPGQPLAWWALSPLAGLLPLSPALLPAPPTPRVQQEAGSQERAHQAAGLQGRLRPAGLRTDLHVPRPVS